MALETLSLRQLNRATLARQMLLGRENATVVETVDRLAGMQAQEAKPPFIGLWSRVDGFQMTDLHTALHSRAVVRATMMRGTLHLLSAADYLAFRTLFEPLLAAAMKVLGDRAEGLDIDAVLPIAREFLRERPHTFTEIRTRLLQSFPDVNDRALGFTVRMHLPLVMFPTSDRWSFPGDAAFTPANEWLGTAHNPEGSRTELMRRYLAAFGPATAADFQEWSGLQGAKALLAEMRPELHVFRDDKGRELFDLPDAPRPNADMPAAIRFLPEFDNVVLAHADRRRIIDDEHRKPLVTKNGRVRATVLIDGFAAGFWDWTRKRDTATLQLMPFAVIGKSDREALEAEGDALLRFLEPDSGKRDFCLIENAT